MPLFDPQYKQKLIERMEKRNQQGNLLGIYTIGRYYSPQERIDEARRGTEAGEEFLFAEKKLMDELKRRM